MNAKAAKLDADLATTDIATLGGLDDWAVNELRGLARAGSVRFAGEPTSNLVGLVRAERERVKASGTCLAYLKVSRTGSYFQMSRKARFFVYMLLSARWRMEELGHELASNWHHN